jgi:hypothetical protein
MSSHSDISLPHFLTAAAYYSAAGYVPSEAPTIVSEAASALTAPPGVVDLYHAPGRVYVASAEQSFLDIVLRGGKPPQRGMYLTPCVRDELVLDDLHLRVFLKLELIHFGGDQRDLPEILQVATGFFSRYIPVQAVETSSGVDLQSPEGVELGSYGVRRVCGVPYVYGTGLAEPRFSYARQLHLGS